MYIIFNFYHTLVSGRNLTFYIDIQFSSSFTNIWSFNSPCAAAAAVNICLGNSGLWKIPDPLLRSCQRDEVNMNDLTKCIRALQIFVFATNQMGEMKTHVQLIWKFHLVSRALSHTHSPLWEIQFSSYPERTPIDLTWVNLMPFNHLELQCLHL